MDRLLPFQGKKPNLNRHAGKCILKPNCRIFNCIIYMCLLDGISDYNHVIENCKSLEYILVFCTIWKLPMPGVNPQGINCCSWRLLSDDGSSNEYCNSSTAPDVLATEIIMTLERRLMMLHLVFEWIYSCEKKNSLFLYIIMHIRNCYFSSLNMQEASNGSLQ